MSRQIKYDGQARPAGTYRDRSVNVQTFLDVRLLADIVHALERAGAPARELTASNVMRLCAERVHAAICAQGDGLRFMRVEEARAYLAERGFSMRQLGTTGTYGGREYMKSLVLQDRALEEKEQSGQAHADDAYTEAMNEIADALEQSPAFASMSEAERWKHVQTEMRKRGFAV